VDETLALARATRVRDASRLIRTMMTTDAPVDSVSIGRAMEIGAVAASRKSMEGTSNHLFRTSERYLPARSPKVRLQFYHAWATAAMRFTRYETALALLDSVNTRVPTSPEENAIQSVVHSSRVWVQFVAALLDRSLSADGKADMKAAVRLARTNQPVWTSLDGSTHDALSRSQLAQAMRLMQTSRTSEALPILHVARARADRVGDVWAHQMSMYLESVVQRNRDQFDAAHATLQALRDVPDDAREIAFQSLAILDQLQIAAERQNADRAGEALSALSTVSNISPSLFARASAIHAAAFDRSVWTSTETWSQILVLTLILAAVLQFGYWAYRRNEGDEDAAAADDSGPDPADSGSSDTRSSDEPDEAYRVPRGLDDPVVNDHATVAFDVQIDLDAREIEQIIRATPFSGGRSGRDVPDEAADAPADDTTDNATDDAEASDPPTWNLSQNLTDDDALVDDSEASADEAPSDADPGHGSFEGNTTGPRVPGTPIRSEGADAAGDARSDASDLPQHVRVPCYGPDGSERDAVEIPARIASGLIKRKIIALEADGEVLLLYRFETGTNHVVHYDPESGTFSEVAEETFHAFPIARVQSPE